jgi:hypothetical protein
MLCIIAPALALALLSGSAPPPKGKVLQAEVSDYLAADLKHQAEMRQRYDDDLAPLVAGKDLVKLREEMLKIANGGSKPRFTQHVNYLDEDKHLGKYIVASKQAKVLMVGLHGDAKELADAEAAAKAMAVGDWFWVFPQLPDAVQYAWSEESNEQLVLKVIEEAKRTGKVDPNHIYLVGHGLGGYGAWTLGAHHADMFAGIGAFAGAPSPIAGAGGIAGIAEGVIPNFFNLPVLFYQSQDDPVQPPGTNAFVSQELSRWKTQHPGGFDFKYLSVDGRGHGAPADGYLPSLQWLANHGRVGRPRKILWQPVLDWKRQDYWLYWDKPRRGAIVQVEAKEGNTIEVTNLTDPKDATGLTLLLGEPLVDLSADVTVMVNGRRRFQGKIPRTFSTLLLTLPRHDGDLLFDARFDL